jgi:hypothetical protein
LTDVKIFCNQVGACATSVSAYQDLNLVHQLYGDKLGVSFPVDVKVGDLPVPLQQLAATAWRVLI